MSTNFENNFKIKPNELVNIMNLYKQRTEKCEEIEYFKKENGINNLLNKLDIKIMVYLQLITEKNSSEAIKYL